MSIPGFATLSAKAEFIAALPNAIDVPQRGDYFIVAMSEKKLQILFDDKQRQIRSLGHDYGTAVLQGVELDRQHWFKIQARPEIVHPEGSILQNSPIRMAGGEALNFFVDVMLRCRDGQVIEVRRSRHTMSGTSTEAIRTAPECPSKMHRDDFPFHAIVSPFPPGHFAHWPDARFNDESDPKPMAPYSVTHRFTEQSMRAHLHHTQMVALNSTPHLLCGFDYDKIVDSHFADRDTTVVPIELLLRISGPFEYLHQLISQSHVDRETNMFWLRIANPGEVVAGVRIMSPAVKKVVELAEQAIAFEMTIPPDCVEVTQVKGVSKLNVDLLMAEWVSGEKAIPMQEAILLSEEE
jgi:hypothetical protein